MGVVLTLNAGSSSLKFAAFANDLALLRGKLDGIGHAPHMVAKDAKGVCLLDRAAGDAGQTHEDLLPVLLDWVDAHLGRDALSGAGHRVVHGGAHYVAPVLIDAKVLADLEALTPFAPLHQPHSLAPIRAISAARPDLRQVACFDTAFHATMPDVARRYALPRRYEEEGVRRYGFHGISYEFIARRLRQIAPALAAGRVIVAHLGNGASLCAMRDGQSLDTTMGFTALDGLVMGTRCGELDPGIVLYFLQQERMDAAGIEDLLYRKSGLLGVSGIGGDMRELEASPAASAADAIELFTYRIARQMGSLASSLGGLDAIVFTGGIGEASARTRREVGRRLAWLDVEIDAAANLRADTVISGSLSRIIVMVVPTDEEAMIAAHTNAVLGAA